MKTKYEVIENATGAKMSRSRPEVMGSTLFESNKAALGWMMSVGLTHKSHHVEPVETK